MLLSDLASFVGSIGPALVQRLGASAAGGTDADRDIEAKLTKLLGEDNLVGSAGEFGLLFAFFANKPDARQVDGEPAIAVSDLQAIFVDKRFPEGWRSWKKSRADWVEEHGRTACRRGR